MALTVLPNFMIWYYPTSLGNNRSIPNAVGMFSNVDLVIIVMYNMFITYIVCRPLLTATVIKQHDNPRSYIVESDGHHYRRNRRDLNKTK